ncbi:hypothetical protein D3C80_1990730 [compost metagenome]
MLVPFVMEYIEHLSEIQSFWQLVFELNLLDLISRQWLELLYFCVEHHSIAASPLIYSEWC